jgi:hypothetical protein
MDIEDFDFHTVTSAVTTRSNRYSTAVTGALKKSANKV